ncbi:MAG: hypothetical protein ACI8RD_004926 [Bacillariaceae sp.]|jgi:hypothetical protein
MRLLKKTIWKIKRKEGIHKFLDKVFREALDRNNTEMLIKDDIF